MFGGSLAFYAESRILRHDFPGQPSLGMDVHFQHLRLSRQSGMILGLCDWLQFLNTVSGRCSEHRVPSRESSSKSNSKDTILDSCNLVWNECNQFNCSCHCFVTTFKEKYRIWYDSAHWDILGRTWQTPDARPDPNTRNTSLFYDSIGQGWWIIT